MITTGVMIGTHLNKYGSINWEKIASYLKGFPDIVLDYELLMKHEPENLDAKAILTEEKNRQTI